MNKQLDGLNSQSASHRNSIIAGIAIIALGLIALAGQLGIRGMDGLILLPALASIFLAWGLLTRTFGLVIPGGILSGVALGAYLVQGPLAGASEPVEGAIFLLAMSLGWVLVAALSLVTAANFQWWPLIPAAILAATGALLIAGSTGIAILQALGFIWPVVLIAAGAFVLIRRK